MNIINVLLDSLKLLERRPQLFLPKISSALISSVWTIFLFDLFAKGQLQLLTKYYILTLPFIIVLGVFVPILTAEMIKNRDRDRLLTSSFFETTHYWRKIVAMSFMMLGILFVTSAPASIGFMAYSLTGSLAFAAAGLGISVLAILVTGFLIYFLPISLLSKDSFMSGVKSSVNTSMENRREVTLLMVFSFGLFGLAFASQGALRKLGFAAFIFGRMLSATVTTYTFVISPNYYLREKEEKEND